jgi:hypothetical protein
MTWNELRDDDVCRGRWVALDGLGHGDRTGKAAARELVDVDDDLDALCSRVRDSARKHCAIVFVG